MKIQLGAGEASSVQGRPHPLAGNTMQVVVAWA